MTRIFIDSDVLLDFLLERDPFATSAKELIFAAKSLRIELFTSAVVLTNVYYFLEKYSTPQIAKEKLEKLYTILTLIQINDSTVKKAFASKFIDFEDALQNFCAEEAKLKIIITRNIKDYKHGTLEVLTPKDFLAKQ